jgi:Xaa-Pro dipeptidase
MAWFPAGEYRQRLDNLRGAVRDAGLDLFVVTALDSIYYLTGTGFEPLERPFFLLVSPEFDRPPRLLCPRLDRDHMAGNTQLALGEVHTYWESPAPPGRGWADRLRELIAPARAVGVEPTLSLDLVGELAGWAPRAVPLVERLRVVKSPTEIEMIRRAARYADYGVRRLLASAYRGSTVAEGLAQTRAVAARILREVADWEPLTTRVVMAPWAAPASAMPHTIPNLWDRLEDGPHEALVLTRVSGYSAESERTYFTVPPTAAMRRAFGAMLRAREVALRLVRPGVPAAEIDAAVSAFLRAEYPDYQTEAGRLHRTGHGIGLGTHEAPWVAEGSGDVLAANMVISVEPGIYVPGCGGFRHSDTVLVTRDGYQLLTDLPTDLEALTITGWRPVTRLKGWFVRRAMRVAWHEQAARDRGPALSGSP